MVKAVVTGGAGFIGSNLVEYLLREDVDEVVVIDNLSSGRREFLSHIKDGRLRLIVSDLKKPDPTWVEEFRSADIVYHFAANPEVRTSVTDPEIHFQENVVASFNVLEACRKGGVKELVFASSSTVYGDAVKFPTPEDYHPLVPISIYGAAKLAVENLITTYSVLYGIKGAILRFANIVGPRQSHGVIVDFIRKLRENPHRLEILGDGTQKKSYLHVSDLLKGMSYILDYLRRSDEPFQIFNLGNKDWVNVVEIADLVTEEMGLSNVEYVFKPATPDGRGWKGDVKFMLLDISRIESLGWTPRLSSKEALREAVRWLLGASHD
ncbi:MAG: UDP-glucose 4-epimerase [Thermoprotei archaeon]|nr:MAG: UDP-glucose 4-epimerase [Thermoprotei archaeon]